MNYDKEESRIGRVFDGGAYRDSDDDKFDYEGFLSPTVIEAYSAYMHKHRKQSNDVMRDSDNWQAGIPMDQYVKSAFRHFMDLWMYKRGYVTRDGIDEALGGLLFNVMGFWHEYLKSDGGHPRRDNETWECYDYQLHYDPDSIQVEEVPEGRTGDPSCECGACAHSCASSDPFQEWKDSPSKVAEVIENPDKYTPYRTPYWESLPLGPERTIAMLADATHDHDKDWREKQRRDRGLDEVPE
jgi:hypothetical protein